MTKNVQIHAGKNKEFRNLSIERLVNHDIRDLGRCVAHKFEPFEES